MSLSVSLHPHVCLFFCFIPAKDIELSCGSLKKLGKNAHIRLAHQKWRGSSFFHIFTVSLLLSSSSDEILSFKYVADPAEFKLCVRVRNESVGNKDRFFSLTLSVAYSPED